MTEPLTNRLDKYVPKTALVKKLMELRNAAIAKGMPLMTAEEISEELARRRGENEGQKNGMNQVFNYFSWVKRLPTDCYWTRCVGHITTQGDESTQEIGRVAVEDILKKWNAKTMFICQLEVTKE